MSADEVLCFALCTHPLEGKLVQKCIWVFVMQRCVWLGRNKSVMSFCKCWGAVGKGRVLWLRKECVWSKLSQKHITFIWQIWYMTCMHGISCFLAKRSKDWSALEWKMVLLQRSMINFQGFDQRDYVGKLATWWHWANTTWCSLGQKDWIRAFWKEANERNKFHVKV